MQRHTKQSSTHRVAPVRRVSRSISTSPRHMQRKPQQVRQHTTTSHFKLTKSSILTTPGHFMSDIPSSDNNSQNSHPKSDNNNNPKPFTYNTRPVSRKNRENIETYRELANIVKNGWSRDLKVWLADPEKRNKIDFDAQDPYGSTLLCTAAKKHFYGVLMELLPLCDVNASSAQGPPLFHAVATLDLSITRALLDYGANVDATNNNQQTALMVASTLTNVAYLLSLIEHGASIDARDGAGRTALMYAAKRGVPHAVACLRDRGATIGLVDNKGLSALDYAQQREDDQIADIMHILNSPAVSKPLKANWSPSNRHNARKNIPKPQNNAAEPSPVLKAAQETLQDTVPTSN